MTAPSSVRPVGLPCASSSGVLSWVVMPVRNCMVTAVSWSVAGDLAVNPVPVLNDHPGNGRHGGTGVPSASVVGLTATPGA
ncbi:hypothetical protein ACI1MP_31730 [Kitasatospora griseola]|uniref:hypothetical protein n=1 Tax=Kitasatospora griseola TaxID=2064 RepID=UPI003855D44A